LNANSKRKEYKMKKKHNAMTHGECYTKLYRSWDAMIDRTCNSNNARYHDYGGRGITVCNEWRTYEPFSQWAKENGYEEGLTLDRINVDGNYEPSNCRWATRQEQANNRRNNVIIEYNGRSQTIAEWCRELNLSYEMVRRRLKRGWDGERALTTPPLR
jgi:hypothetical protein